MAIAFGAVIGEVHTTGSGTTKVLTTSASVPSGGKIIFCVNWFHATTTLSSVTGGGLTWTIDKQQLGTPGSASYHAAIVQADAPSGLASGTALTANFSASQDTAGIGAFYITGAATGAGSVDATGGAGYTVNNGTSAATVATTTADTLIIQSQFIDFLTTEDVTPVAGMNEIYDVASADGWKFEIAYRVVTSASTYNIGATWPSTAAPWALAGVAYKVAAAAATLEQEGYRWRNDDGSETTATWNQSQDVDVTAPLNTTLRLRTLINATNDPATSAYQLEYKEDSEASTLWRPIDTGLPGSAPTVRGFSTVTKSTDAVPAVAITLPTRVAGDLLLCFVAIDTAAAATPTGTWTELRDTPGASDNLAIYSRIATNDASDNLSVAAANTQDLCAVIMAVTTGTHGVSSGSMATDIVVATNAAGTSAAADPPNVDGGSVKNWLSVAMAVVDMTATGAAISAAPTNYTTGAILDKSAASTSSVGLGVGYRQLSAAQTENPGAFTNTSGAWLATTVLVPPALGTPAITTATSTGFANGDATTFQLSAPSGKTTGDFDAGVMVEGTASSNTVDITVDDYTEIEWALKVQTPAVNTEVYQFRVTAAGTPLDTYTVTPQWTVGTAGDAESVSKTEPIGITDSAVEARGLARVDPIGITDAAAKARTTVRADAIGIGDAAAKAAGKVRADNVGITDSVTAVRSKLVTQTDPVGIADSITKARTSTRVDNVGITDAVAKAATKTRADNVGITDSTTVVKSKLVTQTDNIGITDAVSKGIRKVIVDNVGLTDASLGISYDLIATDVIGITDDADEIEGGGGGGESASPVDVVGITDTVARAVGNRLTQTDNVGITDSVAKSLNKVRADNIGITDSTTRTTGNSVSTTNNIGITDSTIIVVTNAVGRVDVVGISDSVARSKAMFRSVADAIGITDTATSGDPPVIPIAIIVCDVDGPATRMRATGPATVSVGVDGPDMDVGAVTGPAVQDIISGPAVLAYLLSGLGRVAHTPSGPATEARTTTGPSVESKVVTGPSNRCA